MLMNLKYAPKVLTMVLVSISISACGESALQEGGGAGDGDGGGGSATDEAIALLTPLAGLYDLQDGWNGQTGDEAFLSISTPGANGESVATLHDFDDFDNCFPNNPDTGDVSIEPFNQRIFMDDLNVFFQAELNLSGDTLSIEFEDLGDINNNGSTTDAVTIQATRFFSDLAPDC